MNDAELISRVPASTISEPDCAGYAYVQFGTEPWSKYWCIAHNNCLYIYANETSPATVKTVVLPGYIIGVRELQSTKYANNLVLKHEGISPVWLAFSNPFDLEKWADIFSHYSRVEGVKQLQGLKSDGATVLRHVKPDTSTFPRRKTKEV